MNVGVSRATVMWPATALRKLNWVSQQQVLVVGVDPEQQLLLGGLGDLAVGRLVARVGLEVVGDVVGEVGEQRRAEQDAHVDRGRHADVERRRRGRRASACLMTPEVGALGAAEVRVPLVLGEVREDGVLRVRHRSLAPSSKCVVVTSGGTHLARVGRPPGFRREPRCPARRATRGRSFAAWRYAPRRRSTVRGGLPWRSNLTSSPISSVTRSGRSSACSRGSTTSTSSRGPTRAGERHAADARRGVRHPDHRRAHSRAGGVRAPRVPRAGGRTERRTAAPRHVDAEVGGVARGRRRGRSQRRTVARRRRRHARRGASTAEGPVAGPARPVGQRSRPARRAERSGEHAVTRNPVDDPEHLAEVRGHHDRRRRRAKRSTSSRRR